MRMMLLQHTVAKGMAFAILALFTMVVPVKKGYCDCLEYRIVDHGDRVEAVCIGAPLTASEKEQLNRQNAKELEAEHKSETAPEKAEVKHERYKTPQETTISSHQIVTEKVEDGKVSVHSYEVKYIPSNRILRGAERPGQYSIKINATNNGRRGSVKFKLKQSDFSGFETESITFTEHFEKDQQKTVTMHLPAQAVPFIQSSDWMIEVTKF